MPSNLLQINASVAQSATALVATCRSAPAFDSCILHFFLTYIYIYNKGIRLCLNTFITILIKSLRIPCGMVHGIHMDCSMWTGAWIPYGIVHGFSIKIHWKFHGIHMESIWTVHGPVHGIHHSMYSPYGIHSGYGLTKWLGTQPKNSPYGIHGLGGGIHPVHMESIWNYPGSVKTSLFCEVLGVLGLVRKL